MCTTYVYMRAHNAIRFKIIEACIKGFIEYFKIKIYCIADKISIGLDDPTIVQRTDAPVCRLVLIFQMSHKICNIIIGLLVEALSANSRLASIRSIQWTDFKPTDVNCARGLAAGHVLHS